MDMKNSYSVWIESFKLCHLEISEQQANLIWGAGCISFGDENFLESAVIFVTRKVKISTFNDIKKKVERCGLDCVEEIVRLRSNLRKLGQPTPVDDMPVLNAYPDETANVSNTEWWENMHNAYEKLYKYLDSMGNCLLAYIEASGTEDVAQV